MQCGCEVVESNVKDSQMPVWPFCSWIPQEMGEGGGVGRNCFLAHVTLSCDRVQSPRLWS